MKELREMLQREFGKIDERLTQLENAITANTTESSRMRGTVTQVLNHGLETRAAINDMRGEAADRSAAIEKRVELLEPPQNSNGSGLLSG